MIVSEAAAVVGQLQRCLATRRRGSVLERRSSDLSVLVPGAELSMIMQNPCEEEVKIEGHGLQI